MPTETRPARARHLSLRQTGALAILLLRVRFLNWRMKRASVRLSSRDDTADSDVLLAGARVWVALHIRLAALFEMPLPENVRELRDVSGKPGGPGSSEPPSLAHPGRTAA